MVLLTNEAAIAVMSLSVMVLLVEISAGLHMVRHQFRHLGYTSYRFYALRYCIASVWIPFVPTLGRVASSSWT